MLASDTAQAIGFAMKVGPCMNIAGPPLPIAVATRRVVRVAASVI